MKNKIAEMFGVVVRFDGGRYLFDPKTGRFIDLN